MEVISIQEAYTRKFARQAKVSGLRIDAAGHCAHIGDISPGCHGCFRPTLSWGVRLGQDVGLPNVCNMDCVHCFREREVRQTYEVPSQWRMDRETKNRIYEYFLPYNRLEKNPPLYVFTGVAEPLFYLPVISQYMEYFRNEVEKEIMRVRGWAKIYTNGTLLDRDRILRLRDIGIDEVRVNPSASGFSPAVYRNIELAARYLPVLTVEVPSWPPYREQLLEMLPIINNLGVKHLDVCQVEIMDRRALDRIANALPGAEIYQGHWMMLDDGGIVEEILREVLEQNYAYSVIDCNAFVKQIYQNSCVKPILSEFCGTGDFGGDL